MKKKSVASMLVEADDDASKAMAKPVLEPVAAGIYDLGKTGAGMGIKVVNTSLGRRRKKR